MIGVADFAGRGALVQPAVVGVDGRDVEVGNNFVGTGVKVANLNPAIENTSGKIGSRFFSYIPRPKSRLPLG